MNVRELIELLQKVDPDAQVETAGCDCIGTADGIVTDIKQTNILITREGDEWPTHDWLGCEIDCEQEHRLEGA